MSIPGSLSQISATASQWLDVPLVSLPALKENNREGNGGTILYPYNEGALISNNDHRNMTDFRHWEPEYPSLGCYGVFPNMICSQMQAYLWEDAGLYFGAHDPRRGVKGIDFYAENGGITMQMRLFCGMEFGQDFVMDYDVVWRATDARWESAAEMYREWFETALPPRAKKIKENDALPAWYAESPLVVTYCVRGVHDMDEMAPNALFPYTNALPLLDQIKSRAQTRLMVVINGERTFFDIDKINEEPGENEIAKGNICRSNPNSLGILAEVKLDEDNTRYAYFANDLENAGYDIGKGGGNTARIFENLDFNNGDFTTDVTPYTIPSEDKIAIKVRNKIGDDSLNNIDIYQISHHGYKAWCN